MAMAPPRRDRPGLARAPPAARGHLVAHRHELRPAVARGDRVLGVPVRRRGNETRHQLTERTLGVWHGQLPDVPVGQLYGFRTDGPWDPTHGRRFNPAKLLLDPYARAITGEAVAGPATLSFDEDDPLERSELDSAAAMPRSVVVHDEFDWEGDDHLLTRWRDTVIYELHVKGYTQLHNEIPEHQRGTYAGLGSETVIRYLKDLGVSAVELLPVHHFLTEPSVAERGMANYWGYNSIGFFAPHAAYSSSGSRGQQVTEFKQMVKNFHRAGIEVILDVVYNHTAEGGTDGPTYSFRGAGRPRLLQALRHRPRLLLGRHRVRQHGGQHQPRRAADDPRLAALLGHRDARRRVPLRPDVRAGPDRARDRHARCVHDRHPARPGAALREADRRAVGRVDGRLPGRVVPAAVGGVERPVPRHGPRLLARRHGRHPRDLVPAGRLVGPVRRRRAVAVLLGQLHHRARRLHAARPGVVQREAQRGQRRAQPRRQRQQPVLELRRRGRDRRRGDHRAAAPAGREPDGDPLPVQRRPDADGRRRARPHPARQQQRLRAGQRGLVDRLAARRRVARPLRGHQGGAPAAPRAPGPAAAAPLRRHPHHRGRTQGPDLAAPVGSGDDRGRTGTTTSCTSSGCSCPATRSAPPAHAASSSATRRS